MGDKYQPCLFYGLRLTFDGIGVRYGGPEGSFTRKIVSLFLHYFHGRGWVVGVLFIVNNMQLWMHFMKSWSFSNCRLAAIPSPVESKTVHVTNTFFVSANLRLFEFPVGFPSDSTTSSATVNTNNSK